MSYCRWSSANWRCDLYCYGSSGGGFTTYVAGNRVVGDIPEEPSIDLAHTDPEEWTKQHKATMAFLETAERKPIGLAHDGEHFNDPDLPSFLQRLKDLREAGYVFPDYVFEDVEEEIANGS